MSKIQHRGHCPHCARQQAVRNGGMAKHGYDVTHGYFNGVCSGADMPPMERDPGQAETAAQQARLRARADEIDAEVFVAPGQVNVRTQRRPSWADWADLKEWQRVRFEERWESDRVYRARQHRDMADWLEKIAAEVSGQPLIEVKVDDAAKKLQVGDRFKLHGGVYVAKAFRYATARGVGPGINGNYVEHVVYDRDGTERSYPKRYARKIHD